MLKNPTVYVGFHSSAQPTQLRNPATVAIDYVWNEKGSENKPTLIFIAEIINPASLKNAFDNLNISGQIKPNTKDKA